MSKPYKLVWTALVGEYASHSEAEVASRRVRALKVGEKLIILNEDNNNAWLLRGNKGGEDAKHRGAKSKDAGGTASEVRGGVRVPPRRGAARKKEGAKVAGRTSKRGGRKDRGR